MPLATVSIHLDADCQGAPQAEVPAAKRPRRLPATLDRPPAALGSTQTAAAPQGGATPQGRHEPAPCGTAVHVNGAASTPAAPSMLESSTSAAAPAAQAAHRADAPPATDRLRALAHPELPGQWLVPDFISAAEEAALLEMVDRDAPPWRDSNFNGCHRCVEQRSTACPVTHVCMACSIHRHSDAMPCLLFDCADTCVAAGASAGAC